MPDAPKRRLQPVPPATSEQLDFLTQLGPEHIAAAEAAWRDVAPAPFKELLNATDREERT